MNNQRERIYSYYKAESGRVIKEYLIDHIKWGLDIAEEIINGRTVRNFIRDISERAKQPYDQILFWFKKAINYSIILHDIGKIFFQNNKKIHGDVQYISFRGHELLSALICKEILYKYPLFYKELKYENLVYFNDIFKFPTLFSITYHHHAMNIEVRKSALNEYNNLEINVRVYRQDLMEMFSLLNEKNELINMAISYIESLAKMNVREIQSKIDFQLKEIWDRYVRGGFIRQLSLLLLTILTTVDYKSCIGRGGERSRFRNVLEEYYKILTEK